MIKIEIEFYDNLIADITWKNNGVCHRLDGPAVIYPNGSKEWYKDGRRHRDDNKPAFVYSDGTKEWWKEGKFLKIEDPK